MKESLFSRWPLHVHVHKKKSIIILFQAKPDGFFTIGLNEITFSVSVRQSFSHPVNFGNQYFFYTNIELTILFRPHSPIRSSDAPEI